MEKQEFWAPIIGYDNYEISNTGKARNIKGNILTNDLTHSGYYRVRMYQDNKIKALSNHRLVAIAFIPNPDNKPQVNHIDGDKLNNHVSNLEWCTQSENQLHAYKNGLQKPYISKECRDKLKEQKSRKVIDINTNVIYPSIKEAAENFGIARYTLGSYLSGKIKTNKTSLRFYE